MTPPDHLLELPPDPHEDWYFSYPLPPNWRWLSKAAKQKAWRELDPADQATVRARFRQRRAVAAGRQLAQKELVQEAQMWLGAALDDAMEAIANRAHPHFLQFGDDDEQQDDGAPGADQAQSAGRRTE